MPGPADLTALGRNVGLLSGEAVLESWAARRRHSRGQIDTLEIVTSDTFAIEVWYARLQLVFDNPMVVCAGLNVLRKHSRWAASETTPLSVRSDVGPDAIAEAA